MKCPNCSAELEVQHNKFVCKYCGSNFLKEELLPSTTSSNCFSTKGGVIAAYYGSESCVVIPDGTLSIGANAFKDNLSLKEIVFPSSLTSVGNNAFEGCTNLKKMSNYENVTTFGVESFKNSGLESITIGNNVLAIGKGCFSRMPCLTEVIYIPQKNLKLNHTFAFCESLTEVQTDENYFFPSFHVFNEVKNNPGNERPTFADAFVGTPFNKMVLEQYMEQYKQGICPECGGKIKKCLFHAKCKECGIDFKN